MMPHEKAAARHAAACEAVYRKLEKSRPRTWQPALGWVRVPKEKWCVRFAWGGAAAGAAAATALLLIRNVVASSGEALLLAVVLMCLGGLLGFCLGAAARKACLRFAATPADRGDVKEVATALRADPRLGALAEAWLARGGAAVLTEHQARCLRNAYAQINLLNYEEKKRVEGLALLEEKLGIVSRARATYRAHQLGEALLEPSVAAPTSRPRL